MVPYHLVDRVDHLHQACQDDHRRLSYLERLEDREDRRVLVDQEGISDMASSSSRSLHPLHLGRACRLGLEYRRGQALQVDPEDQVDRAGISNSHRIGILEPLEAELVRIQVAMAADRIRLQHHRLASRNACLPT